MTVPSLLLAEDVHTSFISARGELHAVDGVSFHVQAGEILGVVGESGSGKSVCMRTVMGLLSDDRSTRVTGRVTFDGRVITDMGAADRRALWGREIAMVLQDPMTSLNPVKRIGTHMVEPLRLHLGMSRRAAVERAADLLDQVGLPDPRRRLDQYPHELSGGQRQRVCIALALACGPRLLIADEPTTALDVTVQRQILDLLERLTDEVGMATVLVTHDLGMIQARAPRVMVMYAGRVVEEGRTASLFRSTEHPYTRALLRSMPRLTDPPGLRLEPIRGVPPDLMELPPGCAFSSRCDLRMAKCEEVAPELLAAGSDPTHLVRCHLMESSSGVRGG